MTIHIINPSNAVQMEWTLEVIGMQKSEDVQVCIVMMWRGVDIINAQVNVKESIVRVMV